MNALDGAYAERRPMFRAIEELLATATRRFPVLASATPRNAIDEQARLEARWRAGDEASPAWIAPSLDRRALARFRAGVEGAAVHLDRRDPWSSVYAARLDEVAAELAVVDAAFTRSIVEAARARFSVASAEETREADRIAARWADARVSAEGEAAIATDDARDPRSLVSAMRAAISARGFPVRVVLRERVGALSATGDGIVIVARDRWATPREVARVVLHEVEGHVAPRVRAVGHPRVIAALGSAQASEDEEGRALVLEANAGALDGARKRALSARHAAAAMVDGGASFVEVVRALRVREVPIDAALSIASRVMRGAFGGKSSVLGGLARERVYLPSFVRIARAIESGDVTLAALGEARLSLAARRMLRALPTPSDRR